MNKDIIINADAAEALRSLPADSVDMCVTSPPYFGLRDYGVEGQIGLEKTPEQYVETLVGVISEVRRVLKPSGTLWLNISDSYAGSGKGRYADGTAQKSGKLQQTNGGTQVGHLTKTTALGCKRKDMIGIPWALAFALRAEGWYLRQDIIWSKPNAMPESVKDRFTKCYEHIFLLSKNDSYYFNSDAVREKRTTAASKREVAAGADMEYRNRRDVWSISTDGGAGQHFATFPEELASVCILAGSPPDGIVLDPFLGSGTSAIAAKKLGRRYIGIELNPQYAELAEKRIGNELAQISLL